MQPCHQAAALLLAAPAAVRLLTLLQLLLQLRRLLLLRLLRPCCPACSVPLTCRSQQQLLPLLQGRQPGESRARCWSLCWAAVLLLLQLSALLQWQLALLALLLALLLSRGPAALPAAGVPWQPQLGAQAPGAASTHAAPLPQETQGVGSLHHPTHWSLTPVAAAG
jgi:hypothetical protein